jgi:hypothetical protein
MFTTYLILAMKIVGFTSKTQQVVGRVGADEQLGEASALQDSASTSWTKSTDRCWSALQQLHDQQDSPAFRWLTPTASRVGALSGWIRTGRFLTGTRLRWLSWATCASNLNLRLKTGSSSLHHSLTKPLVKWFVVALMKHYETKQWWFRPAYTCVYAY